MQGHTPVMTTAVLISGGVSNLASLRAFRDSLITNLIGKSEDVEFHLFFYVRLPSDMDKEELDQAVRWRERRVKRCESILEREGRRSQVQSVSSVKLNNLTQSSVADVRRFINAPY